MNKIAIIIPYGGGPEKLLWTLEGVEQLRIPPDWKLTVQVGADGVALPAYPKTQDRVPIKFHTLDRMGISATRNRLIQSTDAEYLLLLNSDCRPAINCLEKHIEKLTCVCEDHMVLGASPFSMTLEPLLIDQLVASTPMIFFYDGMKAGDVYGYRHCWTLNLSFRRALWERAGGFNEQVPLYYDDLAFACRLYGPDEKAIHYEDQACVTHWHHYTWDTYLNREELLGAMAPALFDHAPLVYKDLFGAVSPELLVRQYEDAIALDTAMCRYIYERLLENEANDLGLAMSEEDREQWLMSIYQLHIPLKRLAFRVGFCAGLQFRSHDLWLQRMPQSRWKKVLNLQQGEGEP